MIREVRGKQHQLTDNSSCRFSFVTEPGPFNFIEETSSPLGKRERSSSCLVRGERSKENPKGGGADTFFANSHTLTKIHEESGGEGKGGWRRKSARLSVMDVNSGAIKPSPTRVAEIWKEVTLARFVCVCERGVGGGGGGGRRECVCTCMCVQRWRAWGRVSEPSTPETTSHGFPFRHEFMLCSNYMLFIHVYERWSM